MHPIHLSLKTTRPPAYPFVRITSSKSAAKRKTRLVSQPRLPDSPDSRRRCAGRPFL